MGWEAQAKTEPLQPLVGKRLLVSDSRPPANESGPKLWLDWRAWMPEYVASNRNLLDRQTLTLDDFPPELMVRHCCYPGDGCVWTMDLNRYRYVC